MKKNNEITTINDPIFESEIIFLIGWNCEDVDSYLQQEHGIFENIENWEGGCFPLESTQIVWVKDKSNKSVLVHECGHASFNILDYVYAFPESSSQCEVFLRLQGFFVDSAIEGMKK